jgi:hypothetical protein
MSNTVANPRCQQPKPFPGFYRNRHAAAAGDPGRKEKLNIGTRSTHTGTEHAHGEHPGSYGTRIASYLQSVRRVDRSAGD